MAFVEVKLDQGRVSDFLISISTGALKTTSRQVSYLVLLCDRYRKIELRHVSAHMRLTPNLFSILFLQAEHNVISLVWTKQIV